MRYTECRLARLATEMLRDIDADTVDFKPNYDESRREPTVLPSRYPNLLVNGSSGIAVGMATNIPPHHLGEITDALVAMIDEPSIDIDRLMKHVKGPDFPTGGIILGREGIREAYRSGRGRVVMRARAHAEELRGGRSAIIVTELPYAVKKGGDDGVIAKIADLVKAGTLSEVSKIRDLSDRSGMRVVVELKREAIPQVVLNKLYKHTALQSTFGYNAVALVDGVPRTLGLRDMLQHYLDFQREVVTRRSKYELRKAEARAHILQGYLVALDNLDAVIALIRGSSDTDAAREGLMQRVRPDRDPGPGDPRPPPARADRARAQAGRGRARRPPGADRRAAGDPGRRGPHRRPRSARSCSRSARSTPRTTTGARRSWPREGEFDLEDLIAEEDMVIAITRSGYIKRLPVSTYREQRRGGIGVMGMDLKDEDYIEHLFVASTHDYLLFFTTVGKVYRLKVHELPLGSRQSKGRAIVNLLPFRQEEQVRAVIATREFQEAEYLLFATRKGVVKKTKFLDYNTPLKADGIIALSMRDGDELVDVRLSTGDDDVLMVSRKGQAIRFHERNVRPMGRPASGVQGMKLRAGDEVIACEIAAQRHGPARRDRERLRQAHAHRRVPGQGPRRHGREDGAADRGEGPARRRASRARRLRRDAHLDRTAPSSACRSRASAGPVVRRRASSSCACAATTSTCRRSRRSPSPTRTRRSTRPDGAEVVAEAAEASTEARLSKRLRRLGPSRGLAASRLVRESRSVSSTALRSRAGRVLGREAVDVDPGAELEAGDDRQAREHFDVPVALAAERAVCSHAFSGTGPSTACSRRMPSASRPIALAQKDPSANASPSCWSGRPGARTARAPRGEPRGRRRRRGAIPCAVSSTCADRAACPASGRTSGGGSVEPDELRMGVSQAAAGRPPLVHDHLYVREAGLAAPSSRARPPDRCDRSPPPPR